MSINRGMDKEDMVHIYNIMEYYSAIKRNKIGSFAEMWIELEIVILSEVSQKEKEKVTVKSLSRVRLCVTP